METLKEDLIKAIDNDDWDKFSVFMDSSQEGISELSKILEKKDLERIWQKINAKCSEILLESGSDDLFKVIKSVGLFALKTIQLKFDDQNYFDTISLLCNTILSPHVEDDVGDNDGEELKNLISLVCETMWKESVEGSEELMPCVVRHLFWKCLGVKPKATSMTRLHSVRDSIRLVDFKSEEGMTFRNLLLEVVSSGNLLKNDKGRKILVVVFSLDVEIARDVHDILKSMILTATKSSLPWIAQVYMSTWKAAKECSSPELIECIELDCIRDIMHAALHSPRDGGFKSQFVQFFKVLSHFHKEKKHMNVASMLCRLYEGVLFRCLKAPNGLVRANAMFVLSDVFPLCDLDKGREVNERLLHEQLKAVEDLMDDPNVKARQAAVSGLFTVLSSYWELVPVARIKNFLETIVRTSAWDASSFEVRLCVVRGLIILLDNCLAYPTLKKILPTFTNMFHDLNEKVRLAMVDLLLKVKGLRDLKFWQVVPMEHLLARLEEDSLPMAKKLVKLLTDTYAPPTSSLPSQMNRCVKLFSANRTAARKFYFQLAHSLDVIYGCKFVVYILEKLSNSPIPNVDASDNSLSSGQIEVDDVDMQDQEQQSITSFDNREVVTHLCEAVFLLLVGMKKSLKEPQNEKTAKVMAKQIAKLVPNIVRRYEGTHSITNPLLLVCGRYNSKLFPTLSCSIISKLSSLPEPSPDLFKLRTRSVGFQDQSDEDSVGRMEVLLEVVCRWKKVPEILDLIGEWVLPALDEPQPRRSSTRIVNFRESSASKPMSGLSLLVSMLRNKTCRSVVLDAHLGQLLEINLIFKRVLVTIENRLTSNDIRPFPAHLLVETLRVYLIIEVLLNKAKDDPDKLDTSLGEIYGWCSNLVTRPRTRSRPARKRKRNRDQLEAMNDSSCSQSLQFAPPTTTTTTMFTDNQDNKDVDVLLKGVLEVITRMTHNFLKLDILNSNSIAVSVDVCSAILKLDLFISDEGGNLFSNILDIVVAFLDERKPAAVTLMTNIISSLEILLKKGLSKQARSKLLVVMLKVHDLTVDQSCIEFEPIIEMFVSTAVKAAIVTFEEGNVISTRDSDDNEHLERGQDGGSDAVRCYRKPPFLCMLLEVMNHKRVKTEFILAKFLKLCEEVDELGQIENIAGLLASVSCLTRIQKCAGDALSKCCRSLVSKCDMILENDVDGQQAVIIRWLAEEKSWINETFLKCSGVNS